MRVTVDRNALGGSFAVVAFLLPPSEANKENASSVIPTKPSEWPRSSYYIGKVAAIPTSLEPTGPDDEPLLIQGFIHLDDAIQEKSGKTERSSVVEYLRKGLFWKVTSVRGRLVFGLPLS